MGNRASGDRKFRVGKEWYTLRADFRAIGAIEEHFDAGIVSVMEGRLGDPRRFRMTDLAVIVRELLASGNHDMSVDEAGELILAAGPEAVGKAMGDCLLATLAPQGKGKAPAAAKSHGGKSAKSPAR